MDRIGIRELKEHTSDVLRRVREDEESFEVSYHGKVIARVIPVSEPKVSISHDEFWQEWDRLTDEVDKNWPASVTAAEAVREDRRDL